MTTYEVTFRFETSTIVEVEADDPMQAQLLAQKQMNDMGVDHLPEMWPEDYMIESVEAVE